MQQTLLIVFWILVSIIILFSLIPLIRHDHWTFRVFEFPRSQKWVINVAIAGGYLLVIGISTTIDWIVISLLAVNFCYLSYQIYPYLPGAPKQIKTAKKHEKSDFKLMISNVYQIT